MERIFARVLLLFLLLFSTTQLLTALTDPRERYTVAVTGFSDLGLPREHRYLAETLPRLMLAAVTQLENHTLDDEEKAAYRDRLIDEARRSAGIELADKRLTASGTRLRREDTTAVEDALEKALTSWREQLIAEPGSLNIPDKKPLAVFNKGREIPPPPKDPAVYCRSNKIDLLISGRIEAIGDLVYFSLSSYSFAEGRWDRFFSSAGGFTTMEDALLEARGSLIHRVLGRSWSSLSVEVDRNEATIILDGEFGGLGTIRERIIEPGAHSLMVEAPGAVSIEAEIELEPGEVRKIEYVMESIPLPSVGISSMPAGADVYLSSRWVGETPLFLPGNSNGGTVRLALDGYRDLLLPIEQLETGKNSFSLERDLYDHSAIFQDSRDRLYMAVGMFTLSLPISFFSYSLYRDYYNQADLYGDEELAQRSFLYNGLFYGSLYGTTLLFVHLVRTLGEYRRSGAETF